MAYDALGRAEDSLDHYRRSLAVYREIGDRQGEASCLQNMGRLHTNLGDLDQALLHLEEALGVASEIQVRELERDTHEALSLAWAARGDFERALETHRRFKEIDDLLRSEETGRKMAELEARYAVEGKDREIEALQRQRRAERRLRNVSLGSAALFLCLVLLLFYGYRLKDRAGREMRRANEALRLAQAEREKAARAELTHVARVATMGELATALAHELNQPLTAILSNAQATRRLLASGRGEPGELDEALGDIVEGAGRSREIIQRLRRLIRRGDVSRERLAVDELLHDVETFARADAREKGVRLVMEPAGGLPEIEGDRVQLQQVLLNLVHNGAEAMASGGAQEGELLVRSSTDEEGAVRISVRDEGPPVAEETLERMFDPFFTSKGEGLGMGLPICRTIIEAHGGRLWVERNPERGLTLHFTLPTRTA
jgi:C4-dicarboxylate-specific signal transduction histidine kinase